MPNIVDPVTGQQITDAQGNVVANQEQMQSFANNLNGVNGVQNQQAVYQQLQGIANGTGPNPAQAQLAQATGANVANQAALMAGQRGGASNVGLIAREAGQQGAATQQESAQQAATLQAEQSLGAIGQMGQVAGQQVGETQTALATAGAQGLENQGQLIGAQGAYNTNVTGGQGNVNTNNAGMFGTMAPIATNIAGSVAKGMGAAGMPGGTTTAPAGNSFTTAPGQSNMNVTAFAHGGMAIEGPHKSSVANYLHHMNKGGKVPAMVSPGEIYLSPEKVKQVIHEGANPLKIGEKIPGRGKVKGDSKKNDIVPRTLESGGIVIPRHIVEHRMAPEKAELFVHRAMARKVRK